MMRAAIVLLVIGFGPAVAAQQRPFADPATASAITARSLEALPGVTIHYYDVGGTNLSAINDSIAANAPRDSAANRLSVSSSDWNVSVRFGQKITEGACVITDADARFTASVSLPRLINSEALPGDQRKVWDRYVSNLRSYESAKLWFVYDRVGELERAIMNSSCRSAGRVAATAAQNIERELEKFARANKRPAPTFRVPVRDPNDPRG